MAKVAPIQIEIVNDCDSNFMPVLRLLIQYTYTQPSSDPRDRQWNPLGFKVLDFHAVPEVLPEPAPSVTAGSGGVS